MLVFELPVNATYFKNAQMTRKGFFLCVLRRWNTEVNTSQHAIGQRVRRQDVQTLIFRPVGN